MDSEFQALARRVVRLEKQNRFFKWSTLSALVAVGLIVFMGQATPKSRTIEASEIVIKDAAGRVRARLGVKGDDADLNLYDKYGGENTTLSSVGAAFFFAPNGLGKGVALSGTELSFMNPGGSSVSFLNANALGLQQVQGKMRVQITADENAGAVFVGDSTGFKAILGRSDLQNVTSGGSERTSAASLVLFDSRGQVISRLP